METFDFADRTVWGDERIIDHYARTSEINLIPHSEPRATEVARLALHLGFELAQRSKEYEIANKPRQAITSGQR